MFALDLPPQANSLATAASMIYGQRAHTVTKRSEIYRGLSTSDAATTSTPQYDLERLMRLATDKMDRLKPILNKRIREAQKKQRMMNPSTDLLGAFSVGLAAFAFDPAFAALTLSVTEDEEFQLVRVNKDKSKIDYLRFGTDPDTGEVFLAFNRFVDREPVSNSVGDFENIMGKVVDAIVIPA